MQIGLFCSPLLRFLCERETQHNETQSEADDKKESKTQPQTQTQTAAQTEINTPFSPLSPSLLSLLSSLAHAASNRLPDVDSRVREAFQNVLAITGPALSVSLSVSPSLSQPSAAVSAVVDATTETHTQTPTDKQQQPESQTPSHPLALVSISPHVRSLASDEQFLEHTALRMPLSTAFKGQQLMQVC